MKHIKINLNDKFKNLNNVVLEGFIIENVQEININRLHKAVLILPGGGYAKCSEREAEPLALKFLADGIDAFILRYSVAPNQYPTSLLEVLASISIIRSLADEFNIDKNNIMTMGFSAGGHLASLAAANWNNEKFCNILNIHPEQCKINYLILSYPVITMKDSYSYCNKPSKNRLIGENCSQELIDETSIENLVTKDFPRTFIWGTVEDKTVPIENSLMLVNSLRKHDIPFELHIFPKGGHGLSLANELTANENSKRFINENVEIWFELLLNSIKTL